MTCSEKNSAIMMITLVSIYLIECQNKEEKYIAFLMENNHQNLNRNISCLKICLCNFQIN